MIDCVVTRNLSCLYSGTWNIWACLTGSFGCCRRNVFMVDHVSCSIMDQICSSGWMNLLHPFGIYLSSNVRSTDCFFNNMIALMNFPSPLQENIVTFSIVKIACLHLFSSVLNVVVLSCTMSVVKQINRVLLIKDYNQCCKS